MMNHYLRQYLGDFVLCYLDDILIYSKSEEEHLVHIKKVLDILRENNSMPRVLNVISGGRKYNFLDIWYGKIMSILTQRKLRQ